MKLLNRLIPDDWKDSLNSSSAFQWFVVALMVLIGVGLVFAGINGVRTKRLAGKNGRVYEGAIAQVLGVVYAVLGTVMATVAIVMKL
jgi:uncharacterized membrane protein